MLLLRESDTPKSIGEKIAEYFARPPQPILRFYHEFTVSSGDGKRVLHFAVRNGLPLPLLYGIYVTAGNEYTEKTDHIGPWSTDDWALEITNSGTLVDLRVGIIPFEILTDKARVEIPA
jgi:hypothetical protein